MVLSNYAREVLAASLGSTIGYMGSSYIAIGSGSGTLTVNTTGLANYWDRNQLTVNDVGTSQQWSMTTDFSSTELSGLTLRQFGLFAESSGGKAWDTENVNAITFTGAEELQVSITLKVF